jgi:hypothetical protein
MAVCATCGNDYDRPLMISLEGETYAFDSFECAIEALAPRCAQCGVRIIGHGLEGGGAMYCCTRCAERGGAEGLRDRV